MTSIAVSTTRAVHRLNLTGANGTPLGIGTTVTGLVQLRIAGAVRHDD